jgi:hypothetical protein
VKPFEEGKGKPQRRPEEEKRMKKPWPEKKAGK